MLALRLALCSTLLVSLLFSAGPLVAEEEASAAPAPLSELAWIVGDWHGEKGGSVIEEQWSAAGGGTMMGMFRWLADGKVRLYEFLVIEAGETSPVMRLKHFSPGLVGWEEKDASLEFHLESRSEKRAVFAMDPKIEDTRLVYEATEDDGLRVSLVKKKDGEESVTTFNYSRR